MRNESATPASERPDTPDLRITKEAFLSLSPEAMVEQLTQLEERGELEAFLSSALDDEAMRGQLSYWQKWMKKDQMALLEKLIAEKRRIYPEGSDALPIGLDKKFSPEELRLIFSNMGAVQLTFGCSFGCAFCGFDAIKGVREHIPYTELVSMFRQFGKSLNRGHPFLYWASEPSDYASKEGMEDRTYEDVHELALRYAGYDPSVTSYRLNDERWRRFMLEKTTAGTERRLSVFGLSPERLQRLQKQVKESGSGATLTGEGMRHIKGMGISFLDPEGQDQVMRSGIACIDGVLMTPRGLYSVVVVPISKQFPQGQIIVPLETITDEDITPGQNVKAIIGHCVVQGRHAHQGSHAAGARFQAYTGSFPKELVLHTKSQRAIIVIDPNGTVLEVTRIAPLPTGAALRDITEKHIGEFFRDVQQRIRKARKELRNGMADAALSLIEQCYGIDGKQEVLALSDGPILLQERVLEILLKKFDHTVRKAQDDVGEGNIIALGNVLAMFASIHSRRQYEQEKQWIDRAESLLQFIQTASRP